MQLALKAKIAELFSRYNFSKEDAVFISDILDEFDTKQSQSWEASESILLTQRDRWI